MSDVEEPVVVDSRTARRVRPANRSSGPCSFDKCSLQRGRVAGGRRPRPTQVGQWRSLETLSVDERSLRLGLFTQVQQAMEEQLDSNHVV